MIRARLDLRFLKMFFWGLDHCEESGDDDWHLRSLISNMGRQLRLTAKEFQAYSGREFEEFNITDWNQMRYPLLKSIVQLKNQAKESCILFLGGAFECNYYNKVRFSMCASEIDDFIGFILENVELLRVTNLITTVKQQMGIIEGKLQLFRNFAYLVTHWTNGGKSSVKLLFHIGTWVNRISCLLSLYWIEGMDEKLASTMGIMLSDLMHKMSSNPEVVALYLDVLKASRYHKFQTTRRHDLEVLKGGRYHQFEGTMIPQLLSSYVDFLLEDLVIPSTEDNIEILREGLIFSLSFVMDRPKDDSEDSGNANLILAQIDAIIKEVPAVICSIYFREVEDGTSETMVSDFLQKIERVKAEVRELCVMNPHPSQFNSPRINAVGFLDFLLGNLKRMLEMEMNFIARVKHQIQKVQEELASLRPFLQNILELQNEYEKLKGLCGRIVNVVYYAAYVTKLCSSTSLSVWYGIMCLPNVIENIKLIKIEITEIEDHHMYKNKMFSSEMESGNALLPQATTSKVEEVFVGFEEDERSIVGYLIRGQKHLTIISISGMPGQGKTTLAKKVYNDPSVKFYFQERVWCYVSKKCTMRELLIQIVRGVTKEDCESILQLENQDLAERLRKSLKRKRYLIVMDDIWDVDAWHKVDGSFPDDNTGSRILFTSRNHDLASQAKPNSISHRLPLLSKDESWKLKKMKLFSDYIGAREFLEISEQIAEDCKGLPLAVVLMAALLRRTSQNLDLWKQVAENLKSHLTSEGCMHIIELSFKYLPDHLKSCFLAPSLYCQPPQHFSLAEWIFCLKE